jgi:hypothetical protein
MVVPINTHRFSSGWGLGGAGQGAGAGLSVRGFGSKGPGRLSGALERLYRRAGWGTRGSSEVPSSVAGPSSPEAEAGGAERRAVPRRDSACSVHMCVVPRDEPVKSRNAEWLLHAARACGPLVDVSLRSVSAAMADPVADDERVLLRLTNRRLGREVDRCARVIRSVPLGGGEWKVICRFDEPLALEELQHFARNPFESGCV